MSTTIIASPRPVHLYEWLSMIARDELGRPLADAELPPLPDTFVPSWARTYTQHLEGDEVTIVFTGRTRRAKDVAGSAVVSMMGYWTLSDALWHEHAPEVLLNFEDEFADPARLLSLAVAVGRAGSDLHEASAWFIARHPELSRDCNGARE